MTITNKRSLIALLMSLVLIVSLFTVGVSATTEEVSGADETESVTSTETGKEETTAKKEETTTKKEETTTEKVDEAVERTKMSLIINGSISGALVIIAVVLAIKFRKKLGDFLRSVKSEFKKVTWSSKENTRKSFLVVIIVAVAVALILWAIDIAFNTGISELTKLFNK